MNEQADEVVPTTSIRSGSRGGDAGPDRMDKKELFACPGCLRDLKIRLRFFGLRLECKHCGARFVPMDAERVRSRKATNDGLVACTPGPCWPSDEPPSLRPVEVARSQVIEEGATPASKADVPLICREPPADPSIDVAGPHEQPSRLQSAGDPGQWPKIAQQEAFDEIAAELSRGQESTAMQFDRVRAEIDAIRRSDAEFATNELAFLEKLHDLERRLDRLDGARLDHVGRVELLERDHGGLRTKVTEQATVLAGVQASHAADRALSRHIDAQIQELRDGLRAVRASQKELEATLDRQDAEQVLVEQGLTAQARSHEQLRQESMILRADLESRSFARIEALDASVTGLLSSIAAQEGLRESIGTLRERIKGLESDSSLLREAIGSLALNRDAVGRNTDAIPGGPRAKDKSIPRADTAPISTHAGLVLKSGWLPRPGSETSDRPSIIRACSLGDIEQVIDEMALEMAGGTREGGAFEPPARPGEGGDHPAPSSGNRPGVPGRLPPSSMVQRFYINMTDKNFADAVAVARSLVDLTLDSDETPNLVHALWLRNLGLGLSMIGETAEAEEHLRAALGICTCDHEKAQIPRLACLLDMTEHYISMRDFLSSKRYYEMALVMIDTATSPIGPFRERASRCLDRINSAGPERFLSHAQATTASVAACSR